MVGGGGLRADEAFGPGFVEVGVHLVLAVEALEGFGLVGTVGFGVGLRHLVGGQAVCRDDALLAGGVGAADGAVVLDTLDIRLEIGEDSDLARESVGGVG